MVVIPKVDAAFVLLAIVPPPPTATTSDESPTTPLNVPNVPVVATVQLFPSVDVWIPEVLPTATNTPSGV